MPGPPSVAVPSLSEATTTKSTVDKLPISQGGSIEFAPTVNQQIVGAASFGGRDASLGAFPGNLQPPLLSTNFAGVHDAHQEMNLMVGEWCKKFTRTPRAAMFHMRNILDQLYTQVYS